MMVDWLCAGGGGSWSDARLVCGGRELPAHRTVLASCSPFLKNLLLSCPSEESPVFIVLPDFDLDAMSSVLYYMYNGEVTVEKHKLEIFLDIVKALRIYIDYQYLPQSYNENNNIFDKVPKLLNMENVFTTVSDNRNEMYIKIKKGQQIDDILTSALNVCDVRDRQTRANESEANAKSFANLQFGGRQRNSFLRDLFIETYPQNGKANGLTASVLAISNELYRGPTSVLLTNANDKHLSDPRSSSEISNRTDLTTCLPKEMTTHEVHCIQNYDQINERALNHPLHISRDICSSLESLSERSLRNITTNYESTHQKLPYSFHSNKPTTTDKLIKNCFTNECRRSKLAKLPILNQVLGSPWCPRQPNNFKPLRKKCEEVAQKSIKGTRVKECDKEVPNDSNNNHPSVIHPLENITDQSEPSVIVPNIPEASPQPVDTFTCAICNQVFATAVALSSHSQRHSTSARYNCSECGKTFSQLRNYKYHMSVHRGTREFAATCSVCGKYFNDRGYLSSHMKIHRNRKEYKCSMCPKSFNQRVAYNMHVRIHTGVKPHVCEECGKAFSRKMLLKQHQRTHSGERPYACPHCDKRFADRSNMTLHLRLHTGVKPFTCPLCPKSFTKKHHLKSHVNFHTGAKPYSCPRCRLAFTQSSNMRTHLKKCTATEPATPST